MDLDSCQLGIRFARFAHHTPTAGTGSGTEMMINTEYLVMRLDRLIELLQECLGVTGDGGNVLAKGDDAGDGDNAILPMADGVGDSSTEQITKGGDHADEDSGEGVGGLLAVNR
jgi:hypothetical protein